MGGVYNLIPEDFKDVDVIVAGGSSSIATYVILILILTQGERPVA